MCQLPGEAPYIQYPTVIHTTIKYRYFILTVQIKKLRLRKVKLSEPVSGRARIQIQLCGTPEAVFWATEPPCFPGHSMCEGEEGRRGHQHCGS